MRHFCSILILALSLLATHAHAQLAVRNMRTQEGLPSNNVYSVFSDSKGFVWFCTDRGVARFSGQRVKVITSEQGLPDNEVFGMYEDSRERIWLRTYSGKLAYLYRGKVVTAKEDKRLGKANFETYICSISELNDTVFIANTDGNVFLYHNAVTGTKKTIAASPILFTYQDRLLLSNHRVLRDFHDTTRLSINAYLPRRAESRATRIGDFLYRNSNESVYAIDIKNGGTPALIRTFPHDVIFLGKLDDNRLGIGTEGGGFIYDSHTGQLDTVLLRHVVSGMCLDHEGGLWVSTLDAGVFYFGSGNSRVHGFAAMGTAHKEFIFTQNPYTGKSYLIGQGGDITDMESLDFKRFVCPGTTTEAGRVRSYIWLGPDSLMFHAHRMSGIWRPSTGAYISLSHLYRFGAALQTGPDEMMVCSGAWVYRFKISRYYEMYLPSYRFRPVAFMTAKAFAKSGDDVLIGTNRGIYKWNYRTVVRIDRENQLLDDRITVLTPGPEGTIWAGTDNNGILLIKNNKAYNLGSKFRLPGIRSLRFSDDGTLWACTAAGAYAFSQKRGKAITRKDFTEESGYPLGGAWDVISLHGRFFAATENGLIEFGGEMKDHKPRIELDAFYYEGQDLRELPFGTSLPSGGNLNVEYAGISFQHAPGLSYKYRLASEDSSWTRTSSRQIEFLGMPAGDHVLEIKSVTANGIESNTLRLAFSLSPPFYAQPWFYLIYALVLIVLIFLGYRYQIGRVNRLHAREQAKAQAEIDRMEAALYLRELEQKAMRLQMNPHFIFNALNTIQGLYALKDIPKAKEYINKLAGLIRQILEYSGRSSISLTEELQILTNYLNVTLYRFENLFTYVVDIDTELNTSEISIPPLLLQPIAENAVVHGLAPKGTGGLIEISVKEEPDAVVIRIRDNGIGYNQARAKEKVLPVKSASMGMNLTKERLGQQWKGRDDFFTIEEYQNENGEVGGTIVTIRLVKEKKK